MTTPHAPDRPQPASDQVDPQKTSTPAGVVDDLEARAEHDEAVIPDDVDAVDPSETGSPAVMLA